MSQDAAAPIRDPSERAGPPAGWRMLLIARIANFAALRRRLGRERAERLGDDLAAALAGVVGPARARRVGRRVAEAELPVSDPGDAAATLAAVERAFADPVAIDGGMYRIELVLAAAIAPAAEADELRLAEAAEAALEAAVPGAPPVLRDLTARAPDGTEPCLERELARAIEREEVFLQYQPKLHVRRQAIGSAEALVRWQHPTRGLVLPGDFIPLAERTGLIGPLTLWTLRRVIADGAVLRADGHDLAVFVNISGQLLGDRSFIDTACALVTGSGARIGFEITETSMIADPDSAAEHLALVAAAGVPIAIDDYGAGLSSLAYIKRLPASELKIDKMFVLDLTSSHRDPLIVRSTIDLAHAMEMEVTAEGVETPAALALLTVMGCDQVQGFLISRPLSLPAFRQFLAGDPAPQVQQPGFGARGSAAFWRAA